MILENIRVLDLSRMLPGPYCSMILADLGMDVIRIEDPTFPLSEPPPYLKKDNYYESSFNMILNRNKRSINLNLRKEDGLKLFYKMIEKSDIVIESFRPGVVNKLKIDYETLNKINPSIIYCSISGYGQNGPYKDLSGHDLNYLALTGSLDLNRPRLNLNDSNEEKAPIVPPIQFADLSAAFYAVIGILAALYNRFINPKKEGQYIDISISDCAFSINPYHASIEFANYEEDVLQGCAPFYNIYKTKDNKYITIGAIEPKFWQNLCAALNLPEIEKLQMVRGLEREKVFKILQAKFLEKDAEQWVDILNKYDVPVMPIKTFREACNDPHLNFRKMIIEKEHDKLGVVKHIANPIKFSKTKIEIKSNAPRRGENTQEILKEFGFSDEDYNNFKKIGIFR